MPTGKRRSQKRKIDTEKNEQQESRKPIPPYQSLIHQHGATIAFQDSVANHFILKESYSLRIPIMETFLKADMNRWTTGAVPALNINKLDRNSQHVCEVMSRFFEVETCSHYFDLRRRDGYNMVKGVESYFIHQLQTLYNPALHTGDSLLVKLAKSYERFTEEIIIAFGSVTHAWIVALANNSNVQNWKDPTTGNGMLGQLAVGNLRRALSVVLSNNCVTNVDIVFDLNKAGHNAIQVATEPSMIQEMQELGMLWLTYFRPFLLDSLVEFLIPDLANCCLDFIDNSFRPQAPQ